MVDLLPMGTPPLVPARRLLAKPSRGLRNMRGADLGTVGTEEAAGAPERRRMIAMTFTKLRGLRTKLLAES